MPCHGQHTPAPTHHGRPKLLPDNIRHLDGCCLRQLLCAVVVLVLWPIMLRRTKGLMCQAHAAQQARHRCHALLAARGSDACIVARLPEPCLCPTIVCSHPGQWHASHAEAHGEPHAPVTSSQPTRARTAVAQPSSQAANNMHVCEPQSTACPRHLLTTTHRCRHILRTEHLVVKAVVDRGGSRPNAQRSPQRCRALNTCHVCGDLSACYRLEVPGQSTQPPRRIAMRSLSYAEAIMLRAQTKPRIVPPIRAQHMDSKVRAQRPVES